jgi:hypothetical protein
VRAGTYQAPYQGCDPALCGREQEKHRNKLVEIFPAACTMAAVFPQNQAIDAWLGWVQVSNVDDAVCKERLQVRADALEQLRQKALVHKDVLKVGKKD